MQRSAAVPNRSNTDRGTLAEWSYRGDGRRVCPGAPPIAEQSEFWRFWASAARRDGRALPSMHSAVGQTKCSSDAAERRNSLATHPQLRIKWSRNTARCSERQS